MDPTADEEEEAQQPRGAADGEGGDKKKAKVEAAGAKGKGGSRAALGLLHLALMPASGEVTQVSV